METKTNIGRRGMMCDYPNGRLLEVIGRQPVIFWTNKTLEEAPSTPGDLTKETYLLFTQWNRALNNRLADPLINYRRKYPKKQYGCGIDQGRGNPTIPENYINQLDSNG